MRPHGRAQVDTRRPQAFGVCDRCGFWYNLVRLMFQYEWFGDKLQNTGFRVCSKCLDKPHEFTKPLLLPPDPMPAVQPRVEQFAVDEE